MKRKEIGKRKREREKRREGKQWLVMLRQRFY
jgi:hypothetical protein